MSEAINLSETLNKMADYLEKNGWRRGWFFGPKPEAGEPCACVMGAAIVVITGQHVSPNSAFGREGGEGYDSQWSAYHAVSKALIKGTGFADAPHWNDDVCNSKEQVIARCRAAAKEVAQ